MRIVSDEEVYFGEPYVTGRCVVCGEDLYNHDGYFDSGTDDKLCSYECVVKYLDLKCDGDERFDDCQCTHCGDDVCDNFESVTVDDERFCGDSCAFVHNNIR